MPCKGCGDGCKCSGSACCAACKCDAGCHCAGKKETAPSTTVKK
ncbi:unnamed protein product [Plutella xylostella]|uniref:(diamondback moth) hypothetical protein n=1 Tax=Plutella xylostella TaxID=51655 RepID=A0A8S4FRW1_PLUXY|nr:unnamed protein product [Plutella xylostella]